MGAFVNCNHPVMKKWNELKVAIFLMFIAACSLIPLKPTSNSQLPLADSRMVIQLTKWCDFRRHFFFSKDVGIRWN